MKHYNVERQIPLLITQIGLTGFFAAGATYFGIQANNSLYYIINAKGEKK